MLQLNVLPDSNKALIQFPKEARIPSKIVTVHSPVQITKQWERETRDYIYKTLRKWILQRNYAYKVKKELTGKRAATVDKLLLLLVNYQFSTLHSMCRKIVDNYDSFVSIFPSEHSPNIDYA